MRSLRHVVGFFVPAIATAAADTFAQQLALAAVSGVLGVIGVSMAAYISTRRAEDERKRVLYKRLRPREKRRDAE